jgi:hypothetical protein
LHYKDFNLYELIPIINFMKHRNDIVFSFKLLGLIKKKKKKLKIEILYNMKNIYSIYFMLIRINVNAFENKFD